jgi:ribosome maturation factor RimP
LQQRSPAPQNNTPLIGTLEGIVRPIVAAHGLSLFDLTLRREQPGWVLRVVVEGCDRETPGNAPSVDHCADISRDLSAALDVSDPIPHAYSLEVSTPGVERPLRGIDDFRRFAGRAAKVVALDDNKKVRVHAGRLDGVRGTVVLLVEAERGPVEIPIDFVQSAHLTLDIHKHPKPSARPKAQRNTPKSG